MVVFNIELKFWVFFILLVNIIINLLGINDLKCFLLIKELLVNKFLV